MCVISACGISSVVTPTQTPFFQPSATLTVVIKDSESVPQSTSTQTPQPTVPLVLEPGGGAYSIPLHVQHKTSHELVLMFELEEAQEGKVYWWAEGSSSQFARSLDFNDDRSRQILSITGLEAGQGYQVVVAFPEGTGLDRLPTFKGETWGPITATTLKEIIFPLTVGVFGDSGFGEPITEQLAEQLSTHHPDFIFHTGDLVYLAHEEGSAEAAFQHKWYQTLSALHRSSVIYPVIGNHELDAAASVNGTPYYFHAFPFLEDLDGGWADAPSGAERHWYALEFGTLQILFLNTQQLFGGSARELQSAWLKTRLEDNRFDTTILIFHVPLLTSGHYPHEAQVVASSWLADIEASNVVLVLSGHDHNYQRLLRSGITYVVSGGGSTSLYPFEGDREETQYRAVRTHYVLLTLEANRIQLQAYDVDGEVFDSQTIELMR